MKKRLFLFVCAALIMGAAFSVPGSALAASCCGGGSATSLIVPKYAKAVVDACFDMEVYNGFWNQKGKHTSDPPDSDLKQYRFNLGYAQRFAKYWQASLMVPYVWNSNSYSGVSSRSDGFGDSSISLWYEAVDDQWTRKIKKPKDLIPAVTVGMSVLLPTGISPYDDVGSSFDVTGRGFYRIDGNLLIDKTFQPWNVSLLVSYGTYIERPVNKDYGKYVQPYRKQLGDRTSASAALSYNYALNTRGDTLTGIGSFSYLREADSRIDSVTDEASGFWKTAVGASLVYSSTDHDWSFRTSWSHAIRTDGWGDNFPTTDIYTVGVRYVFR